MQTSLRCSWVSTAPGWTSWASRDEDRASAPCSVCGLHIWDINCIRCPARFLKARISQAFWIESNTHIDVFLCPALSIPEKIICLLSPQSQGREPLHLLLDVSLNTETRGPETTCIVVLSFAVCLPWRGPPSPLTWGEITPAQCSKCNFY